MPAEASIALSAGLEEISRLGEWVAAFCERSGLGGKVEFELNLVLEELATNALQHGRANRAVVTLSLPASGLEVQMVDDGLEFDPTRAAAPDLSGDIAARKIGGLGIHLVRGLVQDLRFERRGDNNCVSFRMRVE